MHFIFLCRLATLPLELFEHTLCFGASLLHSCVSFSFNLGGVGNHGLNFGRKLFYFPAYFSFQLLSFQLRGVLNLALNGGGRLRDVRCRFIPFRQYFFSFSFI